MMGIRSSVENVILRCNRELAFSQIAQRLAEGVRQHCVKSCEKRASGEEKNCYIEVVTPQGPMPALLKDLGFRPYHMTRGYEDIQIPKILSLNTHNMRLTDPEKYQFFKNS